MKVFWLNEKGHWNRHSPWHDRRVSEMSLRTLNRNRDGKLIFIPGRVRHHISERLQRHCLRVQSKAAILFREIKSPDQGNPS